jgi:TolB protein
MTNNLKTRPPIWRFHAILAITLALTCPVISAAAGRKGKTASEPQNGRIAFQTDGSGAFQLGIIGQDGAGFRELSGPPGTSVNPAWSASGLKVAFSSDRDGSAGLYVMDLLTGATVRITGAVGFSDSRPSWSPDGTRIAFERLDAAAAATDVWIVASDGSSAPVDFTSSPGNDGAPAWSPDGTKLAFSTDRTGDFEIFLANADGTGTPVNLTNDAGAADLEPAWSLDGTTLAFTREAPASPASVWKLTVATPSQQAQLAFGTHPAFSPDGAEIAFAAAVEAQTQIWIANADGTQARTLTILAADSQYPAWQPVTPDANPPVANAGADQTVECSSFAGGVARLDGTASSDADSTAGTNDDIRLYEWWENFGSTDESFLGAGAVLDVTFPVGPHLVTLQVTDSTGQLDTDETLVVIVDTVPPTISVALSPRVVWPPNHRLVRVRADVSASDVCSPVTLVLSAVTSNEPDDARGSGHTAGDIQGADVGTADVDFFVRAERSGGGSGRLYTATYTATDASGNSAAASDVVTVPHDRGRGHGGGPEGGGTDGAGAGSGSSQGHGHGHGQGNGRPH